MAQAASTVTQKAIERLGASEGMPAAVSVLADLTGIQVAPFAVHQIFGHNVAPEIVDRSTASVYPVLNVYSSKVTNALREKFRTFSGSVEMCIEVRVSLDRLEGMQTQSHFYADAVTRVLDGNRGDWGDGVFYAGGYEIQYSQIKHGGKNFLQIVKILFTAEVSMN